MGGVEVMATTPGWDETPTAPTPSVDDERTAATLDAIKAAFSQLGLESLQSMLEGLYREGVTDAESMLFRLRDTEEYKKRFAANEARRKRGLAELTPGAYVQLEEKYRELMKSAMLPPGFYDSPEDFRTMIENDLSPTEVQSRVQWAKEASVNADAAFKDSLRSMYGVTDSDVVAYFLDPEKAAAMVERRYNAAQFNAAAKRRALEFGTGFSEEAGLLGLERDALDQQLGSVADSMPTLERLSGVYGDGVSAEDVARDALGLDESGGASRRRRKLASQERAAFGGRAGAEGKSLGSRSQI